LRLNETKLFGRESLSLDLFIYNESFSQSLRTPIKVSLAIKFILVCINTYALIIFDVSSSLFHLLLESTLYLIVPACLLIA